MIIDEIRAFIEKQSWIFAKTYADKAPHEYIVRGRAAGTDEEFMHMVKYITEKGITMYFWNHPNKYIYLDGHHYWVMHNGVLPGKAKNRTKDKKCMADRCGRISIHY